MSRRRKPKELCIRVIGVLESGPDPMAAPGGSVRSLTLDELLQSGYSDEYADSEQPLWIQVEHASKADLERIGAHFGLHPLTVEAVQTRHTREKLEIFAHYLFLVFHALHGGPQSRGQEQWSAAGGTVSGSARGGGGGSDGGGWQRRTEQLRQPFIDTADVTRDQAEALAARAPGDGSAYHSTPPHGQRREAAVGSAAVHEGSALLANTLATAKYYGGDASAGRTMLDPSPAPPRRHKSTLSLASMQQQQHQHPTTSPSPSFGIRGGGLSGVAAAVAAGQDELAQPVPSYPYASSSAADAGDSVHPMLERFRVNPEQTLMPGSPQSISTATSSTISSDGESMATDDDDDEDDSETSSDSESDTSSIGSSRRSSALSSAQESPIRARAARKQNSSSRIVRELRKEVAALDTGSMATGRHDASAASVPAISTAAAASLLSDREPLRTAPIKLVVFPHLVVSFHSGGLETVSSVARRLDRVYSSRVESTAWIIHALLDSITDSLLPVVHATATEVDALEELIFVLSGSEHRDLLKRMGMTRRRLSFLRQRLWSKRDILMSLIGKDWQMFLAGVQIPYLRDVYDHVVTLLHRVEAATDMLVSLQSTYLANVQIDVAEAGNEVNNTVKSLAAVGAIILPLQLVASLWGMNCEVPFQAYLDWSDPTGIVPFLSVCCAMLFVTLFMTSYFRRHDLM